MSPLPADIFDAITSYDIEELQRVIDADPQSVNQPDDDDGMPPLYRAAHYRNQDAIALLIRQGALVDIFASCYLDDSASAQSLLTNDPGLTQLRAPGGRTPLHFAAEKGAMSVAQLLVQQGADVNAEDEDGNTPITEAAHGGPWKPAAHQEMIQLFIDSGAEVTLHVAAGIGRLELLKSAVTSSEDVNQRDENGYAPLFHAAQNNHLECVRWLIEQGADVGMECEDGETALFTAALHLLSQQCDPEICRLLIAHGADYDLHTATALGDLDQMTKLLDDQPDLVSKSNGMYPADYAIHCGNYEALQFLLKRGAEPNSQDDWGRTLLEKASSRPKFERLLREFGASDV